MFGREVERKVGPNDVSESAESSEIESERAFLCLILIRGELVPGGVGSRVRSSYECAGDDRARPYPMQDEVNVYIHTYIHVRRKV